MDAPPVPKTLLVMRHAKSAWSTGAPDHARPLDARGRRDAPRMARVLEARGWLPDMVLSSSSERTRETLAWMSHALGRDLPYDTSDALYLAGLGDLIRAVAEADEAWTTLMILGHNPGLEELVAHLTGIETPMTTANVARLVAPDPRTWRALADRPGVFALDTVLRPKELFA